MAHTGPKECKEETCEKPPRMAVRVTRPQRDNVMVTVWTDERAAKVPASAETYCKEHGMQVVQALLVPLVDVD